MRDRKGSVKIYDYTDYRVFLVEYYEEQKRMRRNFSYRSFAQDADVAVSVYKDITSGRRNLTRNIAERYAQAMKLSGSESEYFYLLVDYGNNKCAHKRSDCYREMLKIRVRSGLTFVGLEHYHYFSHWYNPVIRELVTLPDFVESGEWIAQKLRGDITPHKAEESLKLLEKIGFLKRDSKKSLEQADPHISSEYEMASDILKNFQKEMIDRAQESLQDIPRDKREVSSLTLGVSYEEFAEIKRRIHTFKEEIFAYLSQGGASNETVVQLNFQLFPLLSQGEEGDRA